MCEDFAADLCRRSEADRVPALPPMTRLDGDAAGGEAATTRDLRAERNGDELEQAGLPLARAAALRLLMRMCVSAPDDPLRGAGAAPAEAAADDDDSAPGATLLPTVAADAPAARPAVLGRAALWHMLRAHRLPTRLLVFFDEAYAGGGGRAADGAASALSRR